MPAADDALDRVLKGAHQLVDASQHTAPNPQEAVRQLVYGAAALATTLGIDDDALVAELLEARRLFGDVWLAALLRIEPT